MGLPTQKSTAITRDREIEIYKKSLRKNQSSFSGCDRFDHLLCAIITKYICKYANGLKPIFPQGEKSADEEKSEVFSGSGREGFLRKTLCSLCADSYVNLRVVSCNEENVTFSHFTGGS